MMPPDTDVTFHLDMESLLVYEVYTSLSFLLVFEEGEQKMHPWQKERWLPGVLSKRQVKRLIEEGYIAGIDHFERVADYSSIDLHLSSEGFKMIQGSIKPSGPYTRFCEKTEFAEPLEPDGDGYFKLRSNQCYVFKLKERFNPKLANSNIFGQATAKSSIGRVDVIARLIVDGMLEYESINSHRLTESTGDMLIEIVPISFNVRVKEGISLSQLRFFYGDIDSAVIKDEGFIKSILHGSSDGEGILSVDLGNIEIGGCQVAAFRAHNPDRENDFIDLWKKEKGQKPDPCQYWCFDKSDKSTRLKLHNAKFYLLRSKQRIALPAGVAVYCRAMDETLGEMRIHYAGFVHPFFGTDRPDRKLGTPLIFEVRAHNVDVNLADGERLAKLCFYRMSESAISEKKDDNDYGKQELNLSKFFEKWHQSLTLGNDGQVTRS